VNATPPAAVGSFVQAAGFVAEEVTGTWVRGHADLGPDHHTDQGVVHGGLYATLVEIAGGAGANAAVAGRGEFAVGVHNATDFLRASTGGRATVTAEALHQGRSQQLWDVVIRDEASGKVLTRGQLRVQNLPLPERPGA